MMINVRIIIENTICNKLKHNMVSCQEISLSYEIRARKKNNAEYAGLYNPCFFIKNNVLYYILDGFVKSQKSSHSRESGGP